MNWDQIEGNWKQFAGKVKEKWGLLTDDDVTAIAGKRTRLAGKLQERYGYAKDQAHKELDEFLKAFEAVSTSEVAYRGANSVRADRNSRHGTLLASVVE